MHFNEIKNDYLPQSKLFESIANDKGISLLHEDDWRDWWDMFLAGVNWEDELDDDE